MVVALARDFLVENTGLFGGEGRVGGDVMGYCRATAGLRARPSRLGPGSAVEAGQGLGVRSRGAESWGGGGGGGGGGDRRAPWFSRQAALGHPLDREVSPHCHKAVLLVATVQLYISLQNTFSDENHKKIRIAWIFSG